MAVRAERSRSLVLELEAWLRAKATAYSLTRWAALTRFLDDGRLCMSNNAPEREVLRWRSCQLRGESDLPVDLIGQVSPCASSRCPGVARSRTSHSSAFARISSGVTGPPTAITLRFATSRGGISFQSHRAALELRHSVNCRIPA
jgi:hypothetical protein